MRTAVRKIYTSQFKDSGKFDLENLDNSFIDENWEKIR
jgi:hypothetical protein